MKLILSLDGGGTRSVFTLRLLQLIENTFQKPLHKLFHLVVGVSAGAGIASWIAMGQSINKLDLNYSEMFRNLNSSGGILHPLYDGTGKSNVCRMLFANATFSETVIPLGVLTTKFTNFEPIIFSSESKDHATQSIAQAIDASSACPGLFPPVKINGDYYIDGGTISNDPVFVGIQMAKKKWPDLKEGDLAVLSVGTGVSMNIEIEESKNIIPNDVGLLRLIAENFFAVLIASKHNLNGPIVKLLLGKGNYARINSRVVSSTDDVSESTLNSLKEEVTNLWIQHGTEIVDFIKKKKQF